MGEYGDQVLKYVICTGPYKMKDHQCSVIGYNNGRGNICTHLVIKRANCGSGHLIISNQIISKHKIEVDVYIKKKLDKGKKKIVEKSKINNKVYDKVNSSLNIGIDLN